MKNMSDIVFKFVKNFDEYIYELLLKAKGNGLTIDDLIRHYETIKPKD